MAAGPTQSTIVYHVYGSDTTEQTLRIAVKRAQELDIGHIVLSSNSGDTTLKLVELVDPKKTTIVSVTEHAGFSGGDKMHLTPERQAELEARGVKMFCGSHALSGVGRSISQKFKGISHTEIIAYTLRMFGCDGIKVAVEVAVMAADAGLVPTDREIIALGGSGQGVDSALVLKAAHQNNFFDLEIREILCKTRQHKT
jgi:uncharacterized protein